MKKLFLFSQNVKLSSFENLKPYWNKGDEIILFTTHHLFENEIEYLKSIFGDFEYICYSMFLNDFEQEEIDKAADNENVKDVFDYYNQVRLIKNQRIADIICEKYKDADKYILSNDLGIEESVWLKKGFKKISLEYYYDWPKTNGLKSCIKVCLKKIPFAVSLYRKLRGQNETPYGDDVYSNVWNEKKIIFIGRLQRVGYRIGLDLKKDETEKRNLDNHIYHKKDESTKSTLFSQIDLWKRKEELKRVDVLIATPPCQGMSVANHKKAENEIIRNSLVVESIKIIKQVNPKFFIFENVPAFMKTVCTDIDGQEKPISQAIENNLGEQYSYISRVINFKDYGACSSRQRTLVIGVSREFSDEISPIELFPSVEKEKTLRQVIGNLKSLNFGEIDKNDFYHAFRTYPEHMRTWIHDLKEGKSAFDNKDIEKIPHQVKNGQIVINKRKNADKYTRQYWDKVGPCVHTRNDQLASQNTIHPQDDRVFSIRELMKIVMIKKALSLIWE